MATTLDRNKDPSLVSFGKTLKKLRIDKDVSRKNLAFLSGLSIHYIGGIERGERCPSLLTVTRLAKALGESSILIYIF